MNLKMTVQDDFCHYPDFDGHEQVIHCTDPRSGLNGFIAVHNTHLGPAMGGCRMWPHPTPAHSGSKMGVVHGDKTVQTATRIRAMDHLLVPIKVRVVTEVVLHCHLQIHIHIPSEFSMYPVKIMTNRHAALWWITSTYRVSP